MRDRNTCLRNEGDGKLKMVLVRVRRDAGDVGEEVGTGTVRRRVEKWLVWSHWAEN
jgi:hypothetical protein